MAAKYLKFKKNLGRKPNTIKNSAQKLCWYLNYLDEYDLDFLKVLDLSASKQQEHFSNYLHYVKAGRHCPSAKCPDNNTANSYLKGVFDFYNFLVLELDNGSALKILREKSITYTNAVGLRFSKSVKSFQGYLPSVEHHGESIAEDDLQKLIHAAESARDKLLLLLLEETGFRIGELLGVKYTTDIDYDNKKLFVRYREFNPNDAYAKYAEERGARISNSTFDLLMIYLAETSDLHKNTDYLFITLCGPTKGQPLTQNAVASMFDRLEKRCGISGHAHMLRHYFANERRKAGWDIVKISNSLGHRNVATTEAYMNVMSDELTVANEEYFDESLKLIDINDFL